MTFKKTLTEVENLMLAVARLTLGIDMADNSTVRIPYGASSATGSAPSHAPGKTFAMFTLVPQTTDMERNTIFITKTVRTVG